MKRLFLLFLALLPAAGLRAEMLDLQEAGRLSFTLDASAWKVATADMHDGTFEVMISPRSSGTNAYAGFTVVLGLRVGMTSPERMQNVLVADSREEAEASVERRTVPKEFPVRNGIGYAADFTDRSLVGKTPRRGDFRVQTKIIVAIAGRVSVSGNVASGGFDDPAHLQLLAVFRSLELLPAEPAKK
jgi:hypothetical protein